MKSSVILIIALFAFLNLNAQKGKEDKGVQIPKDSLTDKYTYVKIVDVPGKSATQLYEIGREWAKRKYNDDHFLIDDPSAKLVHLGSFTVSIVFSNALASAPYTHTVLYDLHILLKDGKAKLKVTDFRLTSNSQGMVPERTLETYVSDTEKMGMGKRITLRSIDDLFAGIDANIQTLLQELESALKEGLKDTDGDW